MANKTGETAFKKFLRENKTLSFMLPLLGVLIIVLIIIYSGQNKATPASGNVAVSDTSSASVQSTPANTANSAPAEQANVEILPQIIRSENEKNPEIEKDPFETPLELKGILLCGEKSTAIIESGGVSYIVNLDETVGTSRYKVIDIQKASVTVESSKGSTVLELQDLPAVQAVSQGQ